MQICGQQKTEEIGGFCGSAGPGGLQNRAADCEPGIALHGKA
jgi:hypothetical protein